MPQLLTQQHPNYKIKFKASAWLKIFTMAKLCKISECAAFGKVTVQDNVFTIEDIYIYPQLITATTVTSDDENYVQWLTNLPEDVTENLKFQVHSHVNMGTTPSAIDLPTYQKTVETIPQDDFVIFMIVNQREEYSLSLYSKKDNLIYDKNELDIEICTDTGEEIRNWYFTEEKAKLKKKVATPYVFNSPSNQTSLKTTKKGNHSKHSKPNKGAIYSSDESCPMCGARLYENTLTDNLICYKCLHEYTPKELSAWT